MEVCESDKKRSSEASQRDSPERKKIRRVFCNEEGVHDYESHQHSDVLQEDKREAEQQEKIEEVTAGERSFVFLHCRKLELRWSNALAEGLKFFETQRSQKHSHNIFKFAEKGGRFFFGATGKGNDTVAGLAEASGAVFLYLTC
jgi:hypothetical protein